MKGQAHISFIIVAGGSGTRMGASIPKQFLLLNNKPILIHTIEKLLSIILIKEIIIVLPKDYIEYTHSLLNKYKIYENVILTEGGKTRYHSVANGLQKTNEEIIMIHDAVRPIITNTLINNLYSHTLVHGNAIPCVNIVDSLRIINGVHNEYIDRANIRSIQTPQSFKRQVILPSFELGYIDSFTDDASVIEYAGHTVHLIEGDRKNIKITTPEDLMIASLFIKDDN